MGRHDAGTPGVSPADEGADDGVSERKRRTLIAELGILDTEPDVAFDALTRAAASFTGCPMALISLVDGDRQWFKSRVGMDMTDSPREVSFCTHAIQTPHLLEVPDAAIDSRFANNPFVTGLLGVRMYAGQPLTIEGVPIGTLCVIDTKPRRLTDDARQAMKDLATAAVALLTERRSRLASAEEQRRLTDLAMVSGDWLWETDTEHRVMWMSSAYANEAALPEPWVIGESMLDSPVLDAAGEPASPATTLHRLFERQQPFARAVVVCHAGGQEYFLSHSAVCRYGADGRWLGYRGTARDMTPRVEAEQARRTSAAVLAAAERAAQLRSEFLSRVSHELRTPLNAILGFAQLLRMNGATQSREETERAAGQIESAGAHLLSLVNDMLDLSSLDAGRAHLDTRPVAIVPLIRRCLALIEPHAQQNQTTLLLQAEGQMPTVAVDVRAVKQVMFNLVGNAIKFTGRRSTVEVAVRHDAAAGEVVISVADRGPGIAPAHLATLFEPFTRAHMGGGAPAGSGLGLSISRQLVQAMNGRIEVASIEGQGTTFTVSLPQDGAAEVPLADDSAFGMVDLAPGPDPAIDGIKVLYIEDDPLNAVLMEAFFESAGLLASQLLCAATGAQGLRDAKRWQPDVILLDMNLPDMDGLAVLRGLRADAGTAPIPVIAVSADALPEQITRAKAAGLQEYWTKPLSFRKVKEDLARRFPRRASGKP